MDARPRGTGILRELARRLYCGATFKLDYWHTEGIPTWLSPVAPLLEVARAPRTAGSTQVSALQRLVSKRAVRSYVQGILTDPHTRRSPFWNADGLTRVASDHASGRRNCLREIHAILALDAVERTLLRQSATEPDLLPATIAED